MKIAFLGDSITEGAGASCKETQDVELVCNQLNCEVVTYGISGTRLAKQLTTPSNQHLIKISKGALRLLIMMRTKSSYVTR